MLVFVNFSLKQEDNYQGFYLGTMTKLAGVCRLHLLLGVTFPNVIEHTVLYSNIVLPADNYFHFMYTLTLLWSEDGAHYVKYLLGS